MFFHGVKANIDHRYCLYTENFANKRFTKIMKSLWCYDYFVKGWSISLKKKESNKFVIFVCLETTFWQISEILIYGLFIGFNTFYVLMMWDKDPCGILETFYALKHMMNLVNPLNFFPVCLKIVENWSSLFRGIESRLFSNSMSRRLVSWVKLINDNCYSRYRFFKG